MVELDDRFAKRLFDWASSRSDESMVSLSPSSSAPPRWATKLDVLESEGLSRAQEVWVTALNLWQDEEHAFEFLTRKHAMLEDHRPLLVAIDSSEGLRSVKNIIGRLRYGSAA